MANARQPWIGWRCAEVAGYFGRAARILTQKRADLRLVAVILNPHVPVPSDLKQWEAGKRQVELSREAGLDPALLARQPGVVIERNVGPSDYRWYAVPSPDRCTAPAGRPQVVLHRRSVAGLPDSEGFRHLVLLPLLRKRRAEESALVFLVSRSGLAGDGTSAGGDYYMEDYAHTMAVLDPAIMVNGGFTWESKAMRRGRGASRRCSACYRSATGRTSPGWASRSRPGPWRSPANTIFTSSTARPPGWT